MRNALIVCAFVAAGSPVAALTCTGQMPDWTLELGEETATFSFTGLTSEMTIPQRSEPEGAEWPKAMTLIAPRDSAIVILEAPADPQPIRILTQRGETPLLLIGTCQPDE